ncbi:hypothetical protein HZ326_17319 [Fusarium oxysporum f. sp. albedinis]|nr:hypothetical protein HZ326_17319 [Fusarium oxysporum f. sp. albedinis]
MMRCAFGIHVRSALVSAGSRTANEYVDPRRSWSIRGSGQCPVQDNTNAEESHKALTWSRYPQWLRLSYI